MSIKKNKRKLLENQQDLKVFEDRSKEPTISYETFLKELKAENRI